MLQGWRSAAALTRRSCCVGAPPTCGNDAVCVQFSSSVGVLQTPLLAMVARKFWRVPSLCNQVTAVKLPAIEIEKKSSEMVEAPVETTNCAALHVPVAAS